MKFSCISVCINPIKPTKQAGFIQQDKPIFEFHDDLHARIVSFIDETHRYILVSLDNLGAPLKLQEDIQSELASYFPEEIVLTISSTHTHYGGDPRDVEYVAYVQALLTSAIRDLAYKEYQKLEIAYTNTFFDEVGKTRISNLLVDNICLNLVNFIGDEELIASIIIYNCHPTIQSGTTPYFSADYPGYVIKKLSESYQDIFFSFMQGADGDVSTRFTRSSQDYAGVIALGDKLVNKVEALIKEPMNKHLLIPAYQEIKMDVKHDFSELDLSGVPSNVSEREKETIEFGKIIRKNLKDSAHQIPDTILLSSLDLGAYRLIFAPNELFSDFINAIDKDKSCLVCYSNGYYPYVTPLSLNFLSYESFFDTLTKESKIKYYDTLKLLDKRIDK